MTKSELKTGMIAVLANGEKYMVFKDIRSRLVNEDCMVDINRTGCWLRLSNYNEDLTHVEMHCDYRSYDIMAIMEVTHPFAFNRNSYEEDKRNTIWRRKEKKKYTYAQLREILGEEFEVVG